jgi:hypothetical protein
MRLSHLFLAIIVFAYCAQTLQAVSSSALVREGSWWQPSLDAAAQAALRQLSKDKGMRGGLRLNKVGVEDTKVAQGVMYYLGMEMDSGAYRGLHYELSFLHPTSEWRPLWFTGFTAALPSGESLQESTALTTIGHALPARTSSPELSLTLRGPLEMYFPDSSTQIHIKTPREVDVGLVDKIVLGDGVNVSISGMTELRLKESLAIEVTPQPNEEKIVVGVKQVPKINVFGSLIDITNPNEEERLKVRGRSFSELEITSGSEKAVKKAGGRGIHLPFEIPLNDSRLQTIQLALHQLKQGSPVGQLPRIRRLFSAKLEAVTSFLIPLEVVEDNGNISNWQVVVVEGTDAKQPKRVVSLERQNIPNEITFDWSLVANGTLASEFENFQTFLQANNNNNI